jgi:hypothetical protein
MAGTAQAHWAMVGWTAPPAPADRSIEQLLGPQRWAALPADVRRRFSFHPGKGGTTVYCGEIVEARASRLGWLLAQFARLIGAPLPTRWDESVPASVTVMPVTRADGHAGGQIWTRVYGRRRGFPQAINSLKRFAGPTGLEEYIGCGIGIALRLEADRRALHFLSDHYFLEVAGLRLRLPRLLSPGRLTVSHGDLGGGRFSFSLRLVHPLFGELMRQTAVFGDLVEARGAEGSAPLAAGADLGYPRRLQRGP